ncbi:hypothetical protein LVO79_02080 [Roseivivax marinus]|nr:hypothetical protein LVO79_02080 [Roseivivax marinus]
MALAPDLTEQLARARGDLRMGVPVVLDAPGGAALVMAAETLDPVRLADLRDRGLTPDLVLTARRAATLRARAYDGDVARVILPEDAGPDWIRAVADPKDDLARPMKGPLSTRREGDAGLPRLAIALAKSARLPARALVAPLEDGAGFAAAHGLARLDAEAAAPHLHELSPAAPRGHRARAAARGRGRPPARLPPRRRLGGTLRHRDRPPGPRRAGPRTAALRLLHR